MTLELGWTTIGDFLFIVVGAVFIVRSALGIVSALESRRWPLTSGVIVSSKLEEEDGHFRAAVTYRYEVKGNQLTGKRARYGLDGWNFAFPARRVVRKYAPGARVPVRYNPQEPQDSVLEPGLNGLLVMELAFGCLSFTVGVIRLRSGS